jgi:hypothetical protein
LFLSYIGALTKWRLEPLEPANSANPVIGNTMSTTTVRMRVLNQDGEGQSDMPVMFSASSGTIPSSMMTNSAGVVSTTFTFTDLPITHEVLATCPDCEPAHSTAAFKFCGRLPGKTLKQNDALWKTDHYDHLCSTTSNTTPAQYGPRHLCTSPSFSGLTVTSTTIGERGCALTSLAMLNNYYWKTSPGVGLSSTTPKELNNFLKNNGGYFKDISCEGCVKWSREDIFSGGKVVLVEFIRIPTSTPVALSNLRDKIDGDLKDKKPVIISIQRPGGLHFILATGICGDKYVVSDPGFDRYLYDPMDSQNPMKAIFRFHRIGG